MTSPDKRLAPPLLRLEGVHEKVRPVLRHWTELNAAGRVPKRAAINACTFAGCLGDIILLKVLEDGRDYRYDLYGENVRNTFGVNYRGRTLRAIGFPGHERLIEEYAEVVATAAPLYLERPQISERDYMTVTVAKLILPLSEDGRTVEDLLVCLASID